MLFKLDLQLFAGELEPPITDLTGTKWVLNEPFDWVNNTGNKDFSVLFESNSNNFEGIAIHKFNNNSKTVIYLSYDYDLDEQDNTVVVQNTDTFISQAYRIIEITGGTDVTNTDLIEWLLANATQVPVADLTNTEWVLNSSFAESSFSSFGYDDGFDINFTSNNYTYEQLGLSYYDDEGHMRWIVQYFNSNPNVPSPFWDSDFGYWDPSDVYRTISITNGTDATNPDLIVWLTNNATYQEPQPVVSTPSSFADVSVTDHEGYITLNIGGVDFNLAKGQAAPTFTVEHEEVDDPIASCKYNNETISLESPEIKTITLVSGATFEVSCPIAGGYIGDVTLNGTTINPTMSGSKPNQKYVWTMTPQANDEIVISLSLGTI